VARLPLAARWADRFHVGPAGDRRDSLGLPIRPGEGKEAGGAVGHAADKNLAIEDGSLQKSALTPIAPGCDCDRDASDSHVPDAEQVAAVLPGPSTADASART